MILAVGGTGKLGRRLSDCAVSEPRDALCGTGLLIVQVVSGWLGSLWFAGYCPNEPAAPGSGWSQAQQRARQRDSPRSYRGNYPIWRGVGYPRPDHRPGGYKKDARRAASTHRRSRQLACLSSERCH